MPMVLSVTYMLAEKTGSVIPPHTLSEHNQPVLYDFRRPVTLSREHARTLALSFESVARQFGTQLTAQLRVLSQVTLEGVEMHTYDDYVGRLPDTTVMVLCAIEGSHARGVMQFPASGALNWVAHILGAQLTTVVPDRKFTRIERTLVESLVSETLDSLNYSMGGLLSNSITVDGVHYNSQFAQAAGKSDLMICATFTVRVADAEVEVTLALPAEAVLPQMGEGSAPVPTELDAELLRHHLSNVPMDLALSLTETAVTPEEILRLSEGDVLKLHHIADRPMLLTADGQHIGTAAPGQRSGRVSAVVVNTSESA